MGKGVTVIAAEDATASAPRSIVAAWIPLAVFGILAVAFTGLGYLTFERHRDEIKKAQQINLGAITDLKVAQISAWLNERKQDAAQTANDPLLIGEFEHWLQQSAPADARRARIVQRLESIRRAYGYDAVLLLDQNGAPLLASDANAAPPSAFGVAAARKAMRAHEVVMSDIGYGESGGRPRREPGVHRRLEPCTGRQQAARRDPAPR